MGSSDEAAISLSGVSLKTEGEPISQSKVARTWTCRYCVKHRNDRVGCVRDLLFMEKSRLGWSELPTRASGGFVRRREVASGQGPIRPHFLPAAEVGRVDRQVSHEGDVETLSSSHPAQSDFDDQSGRTFGQPGPSLTIRRFRSGCSGASGISSGTQTGRHIMTDNSGFINT